MGCGREGGELWVLGFEFYYISRRRWVRQKKRQYVKHTASIPPPSPQQAPKEYMFFEFLI